MENLVTALKTNWKLLVSFVLLLVGLLITLYMMQSRQIFKSRASEGLMNGLSIVDENGAPLIYQDGAFKSSSRRIKVGIKDLEQLK